MRYRTIQYEQIKDKLQKDRNVKLEDIEKAIKAAVYMAVLEKENVTKKFNYIESKFIEYYELDKLFNEKDIDYIFNLVIGSDEFINEIYELSLKNIQSYYLTFIAGVKDADLKLILAKMLEDLSSLNGKASDNELIANNTYVQLLNSELNIDSYQNILKKIDEYRSRYIYARNSEHNKGFEKKLKKALATYGQGLMADDVIALYDSTIFGSADEGFLITKYGILTTQDDDFSVIPFASIHSVTYDKDAMRFFYTYRVKSGEKTIEIGYLPRIDNLRILSNILAQIGEINMQMDNEKAAS